MQHMIASLFGRWYLQAIEEVLKKEEITLLNAGTLTEGHNQKWRLALELGIVSVLRAQLLYSSPFTKSWIHP